MQNISPRGSLAKELWHVRDAAGGSVRMKLIKNARQHQTLLKAGTLVLSSDMCHIKYI